MTTVKPQTHWVHDYETLSNCFLGVFTHYKTDETHVFAICTLRNDIKELLDFFKMNIEKNQWHISFNGVAFDSQITQMILNEERKLRSMSGEDVARAIYKTAQKSIELSRAGEFQKYSEKDLSIKQIDVFKLNHWDSNAKRCSLKWVQGSMRWHNLQDMPIDHTTEITTVEELKEIASYCRNDVKSTKRVMELSAKQISLRSSLSNQYNISLHNASEPKISKELFLHFLSKKLGISKYELKGLRTKRTTIDVGSLILPYIKFKTPEFQNLLDNFSNLTLNLNQDLKGQFKASVDYRGVKTDFGLGGVHGAKRGVYEANEFMIIMSSDVVSYYPNLSIKNKWAPAHLDKDIYCEQYNWFFTERKKIPKSNPQNYVYKIILNATYGLSNDANSYLYDPQLTMRITVNGQLSLMMLYERLVEEIPGAVPIMQNTDGVEIMIPNKYKEKYLAICNDWEDITQLSLEHDEYQKLVVPDVNNYIGVFKKKEVSEDVFKATKESAPNNFFLEEDGKFYTANTKTKGRFQLNKELHKNHSHQIVVNALYAFFVYGTSPEKTLEESKDIFDYCGLTRARAPWKFKHTYTDKDRNVKTEDLQKNIRYYISNKGTKIIKEHSEDKRQSNVEAGVWLQTVFNVFEEKPFEEYDVNKTYYLKKINTEIERLLPDYLVKQIKLNF